jgi:hypothetical protein
MSTRINGEAKQIIFAHKSRIERAERQRDEALADLAERTEERDRARRIAVDLEQQLAQVHQSMEALELHYETEYFRTGDPVDGAGLSAVQDCSTSVVTVTEILTDDLFAANHLQGGAA